VVAQRHLALPGFSSRVWLDLDLLVQGPFHSNIYALRVYRRFDSILTVLAVGAQGYDSYCTARTGWVLSCRIGQETIHL
jgi:hypothetical protein